MVCLYSTIKMMHGPINIRCVFSSTAIQISFVFCNIKKVYCNIFSFRDFLTTRQPWLVLASSSLGFQDNTQTHRNLWVSPRRVICPPPRPVPDKTHTHTHTKHSQETDIHAPSPIRTRSSNRPTSENPRSLESTYCHVGTLKCVTM